MPLSADDVVRAIAAAATRQSGILLVGGRDGFERPYRVAVLDSYGTFEAYEDATRPDLAMAQLFDTLLTQGYLRSSDFQPQVDRVPLYALGVEKTERTLQWLQLFLSTKYLRIKLPHDVPTVADQGEVYWEFAVSARGGPDSAPAVVERIRTGLQSP